MPAFFARLNARRQLQLVIVAATLLLVLGSTLSWQMHVGKFATRAALAESGRNLEAMAALLARYSALQAGRGNAAEDSPDLAAIVNRTLQGRSFQPARIQQGADGELQVRLDEVAFADALAWLVELESAGGIVVGAVSANQGSNGSTNMTMTLVLHGG